MLSTLPATNSHHTVFVPPGYSQFPRTLFFTGFALIVLCHAGTSGSLFFCAIIWFFIGPLAEVFFSGLSLGQFSSEAIMGLPFYRALLFWGSWCLSSFFCRFFSNVFRVAHISIPFFVYMYPSRQPHCFPTASTDAHMISLISIGYIFSVAFQCHCFVR